MFAHIPTLPKTRGTRLSSGNVFLRKPLRKSTHTHTHTSFITHTHTLFITHAHAFKVIHFRPGNGQEFEVTKGLTV